VRVAAAPGGVERTFAWDAQGDLARREGDPVAALPVSGYTRKAFNPKGAIYGSQPEGSLVTIQATRSVSVTVRDSAGVVYFVKQLAAGEAYRVPLTGKELVDVSDSQALDVFFNGEYAGTMADKVMTIPQLNSKAATSAKVLDSDPNAVRKPKPATSSSASARAARPRTPAAGENAAPIPYVPAQQPQAAASSSSSSSSSAPKRRPTSQRGAGPIIPGVN